MKLKALARFCRRMAVSLRAGVDILRILESETKSGDKQHRDVLSQVRSKVQDGETLARAMHAHKNYFPPLLIQLVNAAEIGGRMDTMFAYMADHYEDLARTRTLFLGKISWPLIQMVMAVMIIGLLILVFAIILPDKDPIGLGLYGMKGFFAYCAAVAMVTGLLAVTGYGIWKNWFNCHRILVPIVQRIPQLGTAFTTLGLSRLSMTLSMLLNAGVEGKRSIKQAFLSTGNYYFISGMDRAVESVGRGDSFGEAFENSGVLPEEFITAVKTGELSGTETESLDRLATEYQERAKNALSVIAVLLSMVIWLSVMLLLGILVIWMAYTLYIAPIRDALKELQ